MNQPVNKKTILILVANPHGSASLNLLPEVNKLQEAIQRSLNKERFTIEWRVAVQQEDLRRHILDIKPQIIHYCGHGTKDGLVIHDEKNQVKLLSNDFLADLFKNFADCVECLVLNACETEPLAIEVAKYLNYAIGMNQEVKDQSAIAFAEAFYDAIGSGEKIETAFEIGKNAVLGITSSDNQSRKLTVLGDDDSPVTIQNQEHLIPVLHANLNPTEIKSLWLSPDQTKEAVEQLLTVIEDSFNKIRLFHTSEPIILENQYIPVQVTLERRYQDKSERLGGYAESEAEMKKLYALKGMGEEDIKRQQEDWQTAKQKESRIVVLADPGMGKSTLLRMEVIEAVKDSRQVLEVGKAVEEVTIPLFIRLSTLADEVQKGLTIKDAILTIIQERYDSLFLKSDHNETQDFLKNFLTEQLETAKCLLLLDALDEVPQEKRPSLLEKLNEFVSNYPNCRIIGTSRIVGYAGSLLNGAKEMEIVPFIQLQTEQYIKVWFTNAEKFVKNQSANAEELIKALRERPQIAGLAQNPLLLSLICSLYQQDHLTLPARRGQIYERSVKYMLSDWSVDNNRLSVDETEVESKKELLGELAYYFSEKGTEVFTLRDLKQKIKDYLRRDNETNLDQKTNEWINQLCNQDGILQKLNPNLDQYLFLHRTFQEYFTALHLKYQIEDNEREEVDLIKPYFWDYDWHETLSLLAGLLEKPMRLIEVIMGEKDDIFQTQLLLAGNCLGECESITNSLICEIFQKIRQFLQQYPEAQFIKFVAIPLKLIPTLYYELVTYKDITIPDSDMGVIDLKIDLQNENSLIRWRAVNGLKIIGTDEAVTVLRSALWHKHKDTSYRALDALKGIATKEAIEALKAAFQHEDSNIKTSAVSALVKIGSDKAIEVLTSIVKDKYHEQILTTQSLLEILSLALKREDSWIIDIAVSSIWSLGEKILEAENVDNDELNKIIEILTSALQDHNPDVKISSVKVLGNIGVNKVLSDALNSDNSLPIVKIQILHILANRDSDEAIKVFKSALDNRDILVKVEALELLTSIKTIGKDEIIQLLISALQDDNSGVKIKAIKILETIGTLDVLKTLIQSSKIDIYRSDIFQLSRKLAIKHQKSGSPLIPVYPELVQQQTPENEN